MDNKNLSCFNNFVNQFLAHRESSNVVSLCFVSGRITNSDVVESLIEYAIKHNVEDISIHAANCIRLIVLPDSFYNCKSLISLKYTAVGGGAEFRKPLVLPSLKKLHVCGVEKYGADVFSGCPSLEFLRMNYMLALYSGRFNIHSFKLKRLEILHWDRISGHETGEVMIVAPNLTHLRFEGNVPPMFSEVDLVSYMMWMWMWMSANTWSLLMKML